MLFGSAGFRPNREGEALSRRVKGFIRKAGKRVKAKRRFWNQDRQKVRRELSVK